MKKLQRKIMRGIYYAYGFRLVSLPGVWQGFLMLAVMIALTRFVSLGNVVHNFMLGGFGNLGTFVYNAVSTTEIWTLLLVGLFVFSALSFRISLTPRNHYSYAQV